MRILPHVTLALIAACLASTSPATPPAASRPTTTQPTFHVGSVSDPRLRELSGLVPVRGHADLFWAHNDSGSPPALLVVRLSTARVVHSIPIENAPNVDWEDLATDHQGRLYLADTGNNNAARRHVMVYRFDEPDTASKGPLKPTDHWVLSYPGRPFDCEAFFVHGNFGYLIPKLRNLDAPVLHRFPLDRSNRPVILEPVGPLPSLRAAPVTGAATGFGRLAVVTVFGPQVFQMPDDPARFPTTQPIGRYTFVLPTMESCALMSPGVLTATEAGDLYLFSWPLLDLPSPTKGK